jgi:hypothetical protein
MRATIVLAALLVGCAGPEMVVVSGHVVDDATHEPVEGVQLWIGRQDRSHEEWDLRDVTGEGGRYSLSMPAEPGDLQVKLSKQGYEDTICHAGGMPVLGANGQPHHPLANASFYDPMRIYPSRSD